MLTHHRVSDFTAASDWVVARMRALAPGPFERPVVLAEHPAQWRAIMMALAKDSGCFASVRLLTPTGWVDETLKLEGERREWRPRAMMWRIVDAIGAHVAEMPLAAKRLVEAADGVGLQEFARQVAERFWDYLRYRPELLAAWEGGDALQSDIAEDEAWQRLLWRELCARAGTTSPSARIAAIRRDGVTLGDDVPPVVHVLSGSRMPPLTRELLERIAERREVQWCTLDLPTASPRAAVTIDACHSSLREIETLRERVVKAMYEDPTLRPEDITLYVSDVLTYAPAVEATFDVDEPGMPRIPYSIAGRPFREASLVVRTVLHLVEVADGRGTLDEIGGLLRLEPVARAAGFDDEEVAVALDLAMRAGITWGFDAATRAERQGLAAIVNGTWRHGIDRLVLGVATGQALQPVDGILPVAGATGGNAALIGRLAAWSERVFALHGEMRAAATAAEWTAIVERVLRDFVHTSGGDDAEAARSVRAALQSQFEAIADATPGTVLNLATMRALLARALEDRGATMGHLRGGLRVCRLEPGTVLPARVVLMAGFDDALHPGGGGSLSWDLLQHTPSKKLVAEEAVQARRAQDPDRRAAMLEVFDQAVCSARDAVHVTWTGYTMTKQEERAPSVSVAALMERSGVRAQKQAAHPFSPALFEVGGDGLHSAAEGWAAAARAIVESPGTAPAFGATPLVLPEPEHVTLEQLTACITDPTKYFCQHVLGLRLYDDDDTLADAEPMGNTIKSGANHFRPASWRVQQLQRDGLLGTAEELEEWMRHQPELAYGFEGESVAEALGRGWWHQASAWATYQWLPPRPFELEVDGVRLSGRLDRLTPQGRVITSLYDVKDPTAFQHWVPHVVLNVLAGEGWELPPTTIVDCPNDKFATFKGYTLDKMDATQAREMLVALLRFFKQACRAPQPLYRKTGVTYLLDLDMESPSTASADALRSARWAALSEWRGGGYAGGPSPEGDQEWHRLCWSPRDFLNDRDIFADFQRLTESILRPFMLQSRRKRGPNG